MSMDSVYKGDTLELMIYGQSHSETIGVYIKGLPEGIIPDKEFTKEFMARRAPGKNAWSTPRKEPDLVNFENINDVLHGYIVNTNTKPKDYESIMNCPRPAHADLTARYLYGDEAAKSGGGIFSGRMTAPLCIAGSVALSELKKRGIEIYAHLKSVAGQKDESYFDYWPRDEEFKTKISEVSKKDFPAISDTAAQEKQEAIAEAGSRGDSVGGVVECVIYGMPKGIGGPLFYGIEGKISQIVFAIPAVKGIEFGRGFESADFTGSINNDPFFFDGDRVKIKTNNCGGILGGISVGGDCAEIVFDCAFKPTPSISLPQKTVNLKEGTDTTIEIKGRHDPCVAPRAVPVVEAAAAIAIYDMILSKEAQNG